MSTKLYFSITLGKFHSLIKNPKLVKIRNYQEKKKITTPYESSIPTRVHFTETKLLQRTTSTSREKNGARTIPLNHRRRWSKMTNGRQFVFLFIAYVSNNWFNVSTSTSISPVERIYYKQFSVRKRACAPREKIIRMKFPPEIRSCYTRIYLVKHGKTVYRAKPIECTELRADGAKIQMKEGREKTNKIKK